MLNLQESRELVREVMPNVHFPEISFEPLYYGNGNVHPTRKALVGTVEGQQFLYSEPTERYQVIHHEQAAAGIIEFFQSPEMLDRYGKAVFQPVLWNDGARMKFTATLKDSPMTVETRKGKVSVAPRITIINSYDLSKKLKILFEALQLVCSNGMMAYRAIQEAQKRHITGIDLQEQLELIEPAMASYPLQMEFWGKLAKKSFTGPEFEEFVKLLPFGQKHLDSLVELEIIGTGGTLLKQYLSVNVNAWEAHNAITQYLTHEIDSEDVRLTKSEEVERAFQKVIGK